MTTPTDEPVDYETTRFRGISSRGADDAGGPVEELFFPLPYNNEQVTIVQRLERAAGVTVQGPPGTGKTHTIANIICHYLATGRRVLVTSRGEPALDVLQSKIPREVRPLTVSLLASDRQGVRQFQASIEAIQHQVSQLNVEQTGREIATLQSAIERAHSELAKIDRRTDEIASAQLSEIAVDGIPMRPQRLADLVVSGRRQYGWFDDAVTLSPNHAPPLSDAEGAELRKARRTLMADLEYVNHTVLSSDDLPSIEVVAKLHDVLARVRTIETKIVRGEILALKPGPDLFGAVRKFIAEIDGAVGILEELEVVDGGWPLEFRKKCRILVVCV